MEVDDSGRGTVGRDVFEDRTMQEDSSYVAILCGVRQGMMIEPVQPAALGTTDYYLPLRWEERGSRPTKGVH